METASATQILVPTPEALARECEQLNRLESFLSRFPAAQMPVINRFTRGSDGKVNLYTREIFMPKGTLLTSKIHKTEHQFVVISGRVAVWSEADGVTILEAGHVGITKAGTRRALFIHEDCRWMTMHHVGTDNLEQIEAELIEPHNFPKQQEALP